MISTVQDTILKLHELIDSLSFGGYFLVSLVAIIYSCYVILRILADKAWWHMARLEKVAFGAAVVLSLVFAVVMILAGDVYPNVSPERMARLFAERLSKGKVEDITQTENKIFTPEYYERFVNDWNRVPKQILPVQWDADDFGLIEYHYLNRNIDRLETCKVVLRAVRNLNLLSDLEFRDVDFEIILTKTLINSRFLGSYPRLRISGFSFSMGKPYKFKERLDQLQK